MWINAKVFMELVERMTLLEQKCADLERRVGTVEKRPIHLKVDEAEEEPRQDEVAKRMYHELMHGIVDEKMGRVKFTDGRD